MPPDRCRVQITSVIEADRISFFEADVSENHALTGSTILPIEYSMVEGSRGSDMHMPSESSLLIGGLERAAEVTGTCSQPYISDFKIL